MVTNIKALKEGIASQVTTEAPTSYAMTRAFDPDAWHAMQARDDQLIADQILHGYIGEEFVYSFVMTNGTKVTGVSVVGARQLAAYYGGISSRLIASVDKTGPLFVFKSFEPLALQAAIINELRGEDDFYEVVVEVADLKTGNKIQVRKKEAKEGTRKDRSKFVREHYDTIAESKAFRNAVLSLIPQDVIKVFKQKCLDSQQVGHHKTLPQLREGVLLFAAKHKVAVDRKALAELTFAEINGLGQAAKESAESFAQAAEALGLQGEGARVVEQPPAASAGPGPAAVSEWPKYVPEIGNWRDSTGEEFDPKRHGRSKDGKPSVTTKGEFKARRGTSDTQATTSRSPSISPSADDVDSPPGALEKAFDIHDSPDGEPTNEELLLMMSAAENPDDVANIQATLSSLSIARRGEPVIVQGFGAMLDRLGLR